MKVFTRRFWLAALLALGLNVSSGPLAFAGGTQQDDGEPHVKQAGVSVLQPASSKSASTFNGSNSSDVWAWVRSLLRI